MATDIMGQALWKVGVFVGKCTFRRSSAGWAGAWTFFVPCPFRAAIVLLLKILQIGKVLCATDAALVCLEVLHIDEIYLRPVKIHANTAWITRFKFKTLHGCKQIYAQRGFAQLNDLIRPEEIAILQTQRAESKIMQSTNQICSVIRLFCDPDVEGLCVPRVAMKCHSITAHHQMKINAYSLSDFSTFVLDKNCVVLSGPV